MRIPRWSPQEDLSMEEQFVMGRLKRTGKLYAFLRTHRGVLFDEGFQQELELMYRATGEGKVPVAPALLAMVIVLQAYTGASDAEAVEHAILDARWQLVLDTSGRKKTAFSQGTLQAFRDRLVAHDMDRRLLERTIEVARQTAAFDWKKLPRQLRIAIDSRPLVGAGRVEDTINLLAHAARKLLSCAAELSNTTPARIAAKAGVPTLTGKSIKAALDIEWADPAQKNSAIVTLVDQLDRLEAWLREELAEELDELPLSLHIATLAQLRAQDLDPEPPDGKPRIRKGVAEERRVSVEDADMRHGRKSRSKRFNGFKSHIAMDMDSNLVLACAVMPANRPESEAVPLLRDDLAIPSYQVGELFIDRGYIASLDVQKMADAGRPVVCKPWAQPNGRFFPKSAFLIDLRTKVITCPNGKQKAFELGTTVSFDAENCHRCSKRADCTTAKLGRHVRIAEDEPLQQKLRKEIASPAGREHLRERVVVEHRLAHLARQQGPRARYRGTRKNLFDARRHAAVLNLETIRNVEERAAA
jgi:Transposase DDE domain/Transposase domain (DUF772)